MSEVLHKLRDVLDELDSLIHDLETEVEPSDPIPQVQARYRGNGVLHLQYGVPGNYKKADVKVTEEQAFSIYAEGVATGFSTSFAGTGSKYVTGNFGQSISFGGVVVPSPFGAAEAVPPVNQAAW